jgi:hypothetical protein
MTRGHDVRRVAARPLLPLAAVGALLLGAVVAASLATPQLRTAPLPKYSHPPDAPPPFSDPPLRAIGAPEETADPQPVIHLPGWLAPLLSALLIAALVAAIAVSVYLLVRGRRIAALRIGFAEPATAVREQREQVLAAVDAGLADLDDGDPRAAVIACWVRLEEAAAAAGTPRQPGDTPAELVLRLLATHQVSAGVLYPLAEVYRLARYATHTVDVSMRDQARAALGQLRAELARPAPVELAGQAPEGRS